MDNIYSSSALYIFVSDDVDEQNTERFYLKIEICARI